MHKDNFKHNHKNRRGPSEIGTKTCFVTKAVLPKSDMLRFITTPNRTVVFDVSEKLGCHGFWLTADRALLEQAISKRIFYKAAHGTVKIPDDLIQQVENGLKNQCLNLMSLCRKAGLLVFGYEAVKKAVTTDKIVVAFEAQDSSQRGQSKIFRPDDTFPIHTFLSRQDLGQIAGLDEIVHLALLPGKLSETVKTIAHKIRLFDSNREQKG